MNKNFDVIIVGAGVAGLYSALSLSKLSSKIKILLVAKKELSLCNSSLAQGGIAGVWNSPDDSVDSHRTDTAVAGGFKNNTEAVNILVGEAAQDLEFLVDCGIDFDKNDDGTFHKTLEGGHSHNRIYHYKDETGKEIVNKLVHNARKYGNIEIRENCLLKKIKKTGTGFSLLLSDGIVNAQFVIIATGGIGQIYKYTTNSATATGGGIAFAHDLGAQIKNISLIQFHPTAFKADTGERRFLISEAVRGEGAYLLNANGERFMNKYDERLELAPRDVVSNAMYDEAEAIGANDFYIDITHKSKDFIISRFPKIYDTLLEYGYDMGTQKIPVYPCQHYLMGGIDVDTSGRTTVSGLYAVGECSHTGVHGNNRLASNSLLEACVFSRRAAADIAANLKDIELETAEFSIIEEFSENENLWREVRELMQKAYFIRINKSDVLEGYERLAAMRKNREYGGDTELRCAITTAYLILKELL